MKWSKYLLLLLTILSACAVQREQHTGECSKSSEAITSIAREWWGNQTDTIKVFEAIHDTLRLTGLRIHTNFSNGGMKARDTVTIRDTLIIHDTIFKESFLDSTTAVAHDKVSFWLLIKVILALLILGYVVVRCR